MRKINWRSVKIWHTGFTIPAFIPMALVASMDDSWTAFNLLPLAMALGCCIAFAGNLSYPNDWIYSGDWRKPIFKDSPK